MKSTRSNCGFSLVELIVVVAIMAVLMGILIPTLVKQTSKSKRSVDSNSAHEIAASVNRVLTQTSTILIREIPHPTTLSYGTPAQQPMM